MPTMYTFTSGDGFSVPVWVHPAQSTRMAVITARNEITFIDFMQERFNDNEYMRFILARSIVCNGLTAVGRVQWGISILPQTGPKNYNVRLMPLDILPWCVQQHGNVTIRPARRDDAPALYDNNRATALETEGRILDPIVACKGV